MCRGLHPARKRKSAGPRSVDRAFGGGRPLPIGAGRGTNLLTDSRELDRERSFEAPKHAEAKQPDRSDHPVMMRLWNSGQLAPYLATAKIHGMNIDIKIPSEKREFFGQGEWVKIGQASEGAGTTAGTDRIMQRINAIV
jgi:hypothetical protein